MTEEKAKSNLKILEDRWMQDEEMFSPTMRIEVEEEFMQSIYKAIDALEKQIPKEPIPINYKQYEDAIDNAEFLRGFFWCPNCKQAIKSGSYCHNCGQKLDWKGDLI